MRARIIKIGNSQGIRIPKPLLEQTGIEGEANLEVENHQIIIRPVGQARDGWAEAFKRMAQHRDDRMIDDADAVPNAWDEDEWRW